MRIKKKAKRLRLSLGKNFPEGVAPMEERGAGWREERGKRKQ